MGMKFLLYAPIILSALVFIFLILMLCGVGKRESTPKYGTLKKPESSKYRKSYSHSYSEYDSHVMPSRDHNVYNQIEQKAHNDRMEQLLMEQNKILIDNEMHRINDSIRTSLADQLDGRITNIFRNPWEGIL